MKKVEPSSLIYLDKAIALLKESPGLWHCTKAFLPYPPISWHRWWERRRGKSRASITPESWNVMTGVWPCPEAYHNHPWRTLWSNESLCTGNWRYISNQILVSKQLFKTIKKKLRRTISKVIVMRFWYHALSKGSKKKQTGNIRNNAQRHACYKTATRAAQTTGRRDTESLGERRRTGLEEGGADIHGFLIVFTAFLECRNVTIPIRERVWSSPKRIWYTGSGMRSWSEVTELREEKK